ncbi:sodium-coupled neutral amino acid transporter 5 isoform X2 [Balaenoptera acutorostrata]|nr:sodium-coupled neutral amino acid transporter 5 isoform X3 [Balaenoptera musculus]XP_036696985.1 sodium-coupled neutral amino acid transporter 5 isoform X3 [Balaenoptera musculus]XP_057394957.1 sodium-coupled neutral amino acid transporter 5 isoform X2 [Balaenoptera acutorostrata]XP_057394958.1 sodium-coupled neutral amino acid transporter 5 isoform X2 [Balaenoptera acutorostrata]
MELQDPKMNGALPGGAVDYRQEHEGFLPSHSPSPGRKPAQFMDAPALVSFPGPPPHVCPGLAPYPQFEGKTSFGMSVFNLSNAIMGSGILGLAYAMAHTGVLFFLALLLCIALLSSYSIHLLLTCAGVVGIRAYEQLGQRALGPVGKVVVAAVICLHNVGAMSSYLFIIKSELPLVIGTFLDMDPEGDWFLKGNLLIIIVSVLIILPLALMRHLGYLGYTSGLSLTCMLFFLISVIYKKFQLGCAIGHNETAVERKSPPSLNTSCEAQMFTADSQMFYTVPIMAFAFVCHPEVLPIYTELCRPSKRRMQAVANVSIGAMFCMYALTATFGYLTFYSSVEAEMLHMYSQQDLLILCVRLAVLLAVTLTVPVVLFPIRRALQQLLFPSKAFSWPRHVAIALILLVLVNVLVICVPTIRDIFGVIGSTSAPSLIFILPSVFYLRIVPSEVEPLYSWPKIQALCFGILGVLFMAISLGFMFANWATGQSHVSGH